jgi:hypothetical protein
MRRLIVNLINRVLSRFEARLMPEWELREARNRIEALTRALEEARDRARAMEEAVGRTAELEAALRDRTRELEEARAWLRFPFRCPSRYREAFPG